MRLRHVLVVLGEHLAVLEGDDRAVDRFEHGAGIADAHHLSPDAIADNPVAHLDAPRHQRDAVVDVLEDVLRCETDTGGKSTPPAG